MKNFRRACSALLALAMLLSLAPEFTLPAKAAASGSGDIFEELGIDTTARPDGYIEGDSNPYGKNMMTVNPIMELYLSKASTTGRGRSGALYGDGFYGSGMPSYFTGAKKDTFENTGDTNSFEATKTVAGNFTGSGRKEMVVAVGANAADESGFSMFLLDPETGETSGKPLYDGPIGNTYEREWYLNNKKIGTDANYANKEILYNYLEIETGDFDGNGYDEIAVYIPDPNNPRVEVWQFQKTLQSGDNWFNWSNWKLIFTHFLTGYSLTDGGQTHRFAPSIVTLLAADINYDGVDDLAIGAGACTFDTSYGSLTSSSTALYKRGSVSVLWGSKSGTALQTKRDVLADMPVLPTEGYVFGGVDYTKDLQTLSPSFDLAFGNLYGPGQGRLIICTNTVVGVTSYNPTAKKFVLEEAPFVETMNSGINLSVRTGAAIINRGPGKAPQLLWMNQFFESNGGKIVASGQALESAPSGLRPVLYGITASDLNGDGIDEIAAYHYSAAIRSATLHEPPEIGLYYRSGGGWTSHSIKSDAGVIHAKRTVTGDFTGSGSKDIAVSVGAGAAEDSGFSMVLTDPETGATSRKTLYNGPIGNAYEREWYIDNTKTGDDAQFSNKDVLYNYLEIETGDFDGDGYDEIAVYIPDPDNPRVEVWQLKEEGRANGGDWMDWSNWALFFTHTFTGYSYTTGGTTYKFAPSIVTLLAADINNDGADDLAIGAGARTYNTRYETISSSSTTLDKAGSASVRWGSKEDGALSTEHNLLVGPQAPTLGTPRFDLAFGDIGTGQETLILCATSFIQMWSYDTGENAFVSVRKLDIHPTDYTYNILTIRPDAAIVRRSGQRSQLFWLNHFWEVNGGDISNAGALQSADFGTYFTQYNITAADSGRDGTDEIVMHYCSVTPTPLGVFPPQTYYIHGAPEKREYYRAGDTWTSRPYAGPVFSVKIFNDYYALPDTDHDTMTLEYVGRVFQYSDPKLLTVIAAPPTFGDLETVEGKDNTGGDEYIDNSETTFSRSTGTGVGDSDHVTLSAGAYISYEQEVTLPLVAQTVAKFEFELEYKHEWTWDYVRMSTETHTITYSTNGFQDSVALYSVPTDHFIYEATMDDGTGTLVKTTMSVSIPYQAMVKVMSVEEYDEVARSSNGILPVVRGNILTHTWGDPSTYPREPVGVNALVYNGEWAGVHFGFGAITQSISLESEYEESFSHTDSIAFKLGGGPGSLIIGVSGGASWQRTDTEVELRGGEASGTIANMPEEARAYGYNYAWKLMWYTHRYYDIAAGETIEVPIVTYLVRDVTAPPRMPQNFTADYAATTADSITLTWDYSDSSILGFQIWRQNKTPGMGGIYEALPNGYVKAAPGQTSYSFTDTGLAAATEYTYNIQVLRTAIPQGSVPSGAISVWTHAAVGAPTVILSAYDALVYPDMTLTVTSSLRDRPAGAVVSAYSWEKFTNGKWTALAGVITGTLSVTAPKLATAGQYRLAVSMTVNNQTVVGYSSPLTITVAKRTATMTLNTPVENAANRTLTLSATLVNNFYTSAAVPDGKVTFEVQRRDPATGTFGAATPYTVDIKKDTQTGTAEYTLRNVTEGLYKIKAVYAGTTIFDSAVSGEVEHIVGGDTEEPVLYVELPTQKLYSYVPFEVRVYSAVKKNGATTVKEIKNIANENNDIIVSALAYNSDGFSYNNDGTVTYSQDGRIIVTNAVWRKVYFEGCDSYIQVNVSLNGSNKTIESPHYSLEKLPVNMSLPSKTVTQSEVAAMTLADVTFRYPTAGGFSYNWSGYPQDFTVKCYNSAGQEVPMSTSMAPAAYTVKASYTGGNYGFIINAVSASYVVTGEKYSVGAAAKTLGGRSVGTVLLTSPAGNDNTYWTTKYQYGTTLVFTAAPYAQYMVDKWVVNGTKTFPGDTMADRNTLTYQMLAEPLTVEVYFKVKETKLTFLSRPAEGGAVELPNHPGVRSGDIVYETTPLLFKAVPEPGYTFSGWQVITTSDYSYPDGDVDTDGLHTLSLTMPGTNLEVRAIWTRANYTITLGENLAAFYMHDSDNNSATPDDKIWISSGDKVMGGKTLTIQPKAGYEVVPDSWEISPDTLTGTPSQDSQSFTYVVTADAGITAEVTLKTYEITVNIAYPGGLTVPAKNPVAVMGPNGAIPLDGTGKASVQGGTSLLITASQPDTSLVFDRFTAGGATYAISGNKLTVTALDGDLTVTVAYKENTNYLLMTTALAGGTIHAAVNGTEVTVPQTGYKIYEGDMVSVSAIPADAAQNAIGYWTVNGVTSGITGPETRELTVSSHLTVSHAFVTANPVSITWDDGECPMVVYRFADGAGVSPDDIFSAGTSLVLTASLSAGEAIKRWVVNGESVMVNGKPYTGNPLKITLDSDTVVSYETEEEVLHELVVNNGPNGSVTVSFDRQVMTTGTRYAVPKGTWVTLKVSPDAGYTANVPAVCGNPAMDIAGNLTYTFQVASDLTVEITYSLPAFAITLTQPAGGTISVAGGVAAASMGTEITLQNTPSPGYTFGAWMVTGSGGTQIPVISGKFTMPAGAVTVTAVFSKSQYTIDYAPTVSGTVTGPAGASYNDTVTLTVTPASGYRLNALTVKKANGDSVVVGANHAFTMPDADVAVTATFALTGGGGGGTTVIENYVTIIQNGIEIKLPDIDTKKEYYTIDLTKTITNNIYIELPAPILQSLSDKNPEFILDIATPFGRYRVPVNLAALIPGLDALLLENVLTANDISFKVTLTNVSTDPTISAALAASLPYARVMGTIVDFNVYVIHAKTKAVLQGAEAFTENIVRMIPVNSRPRVRYGAFRYDETARSFTFIPHTAAVIDNQWYIAIASRTNSVYAVAENEVDFTDVAKNHWAVSSIERASAKRLVVGVGNNQYAPERSMSRAEFVQMMANALMLPAASAETPAYDDVQPGAWYYTSIMRARSAGLLEQFAARDFDPAQEITREEMAVILAAVVRYEKYAAAGNTVDLRTRFTDYGDMTGRYLADIELVCRLGLMQGVAEGIFAPAGVTTRAQAVTVQLRLLELLGMIDK